MAKKKIYSDIEFPTEIVAESKSTYGLKTYISLFSSAGVGCYGFKQEGYYCIATVELLERRWLSCNSPWIDNLIIRR